MSRKKQPTEWDGAAFKAVAVPARPPRLTQRHLRAIENALTAMMAACTEPGEGDQAEDVTAEDLEGALTIVRAMGAAS